MRLMRSAHIVVVGDSDKSIMLAERLRRMAVARVTAVADLVEARGLCRGGGAHACIVVWDDCAPGEAPPPVADAPSCGKDVPFLMMVPVVTPYVRKIARRDGYMAALPANIAPRMLYRRIGAALQGCRNGKGGTRRRRPASIGRKLRPGGAGFPTWATPLPLYSDKPTLH